MHIFDVSFGSKQDAEAFKQDAEAPRIISSPLAEAHEHVPDRSDTVATASEMCPGYGPTTSGMAFPGWRKDFPFFPYFFILMSNPKLSQR